MKIIQYDSPYSDQFISLNPLAPPCGSCTCCCCCSSALGFPEVFLLMQTSKKRKQTTLSLYPDSDTIETTPKPLDYSPTIDDNMLRFKDILNIQFKGALIGFLVMLPSSYFTLSGFLFSFFSYEVATSVEAFIVYLLIFFLAVGPFVFIFLSIWKIRSQYTKLKLLLYSVILFFIALIYDIIFGLLIILIIFLVI